MGSISRVANEVNKFAVDRNWGEAHNPKNLAMSIAIEAGELMEIFQWKTLEESIHIMNSDEAEHCEEELADVLIYCITLANKLNLDIEEIILEKIKKNGKKYPLNSSELK
ncbi:nucleotide pyrophosphohydrolase [Sporosalibacterium faouarense]|uniref:nucleotide pyrophosphohydrolase n=1 Tax=Sporosalibacterium faouarense TaxID=516123 RepID=UPI00141C68B1|nr:nucleotide pyrophosphohydrolase [Sporosalibacterium faouarense]MTI46323.1 nucleotide pyrophosphohydrolase [Bacillota bacterium]